VTLKFRALALFLEPILKNNMKLNFLFCKLKDSQNFNSKFSLNGITYSLNNPVVSEPITLEIDSFSQNIDYSYRVESQPLDHLIVNNARIESEKCSISNTSINSATWLNCLQSKSSKLELKRCVDTLNLSLSYGYDDPENLLADKVRIRNSSIRINLNCK
jgi:hypothetical protein